jgi:hypothetical protein
MTKTINEQLDDAYAAGQVVVICTQWNQIVIKTRDGVRGASDDKGVLIRRGKRWDYSPLYQVRLGTFKTAQ